VLQPAPAAAGVALAQVSSSQVGNNLTGQHVISTDTAQSGNAEVQCSPLTGADLFVRQPKASPYYIVSPRFTTKSAGIRILHQLVHMLNRAGCEAYVHLIPFSRGGLDVNERLHTPILTPEIVARHQAQQRRPILVTPETVEVPPVQGCLNVRYCMHFPGFLGGPTEFSPEELLVAYSQTIVPKLSGSPHVLFLPGVDPQRFVASADEERTLDLVYAGKFTDFHGQSIPKDLLHGSQLITREDVTASCNDELSVLFQRARVLHVFENSAVITEALLCGCPVVAWRNPYFNELIGAPEHGADGVIWGDAHGGWKDRLFQAARNTAQFRRAYEAAVEAAPCELQKFVSVTQQAAERMGPPTSLRLPSSSRMLGWAEAISNHVRAITVSIMEIGLGRTAASVARSLLQRLIGRRIAE
jgi:hypothetical protein